MLSNGTTRLSLPPIWALPPTAPRSQLLPLVVLADE